MRAVWTEQKKFEAYLKVEILAAEAWSELGVIPKEDVAKLWEKASFSIDRIKEIEEQTHHDVVAFTRAVSETLGEERKWVHYGLTSTDVVDTANGYIIKQANAILLKDIEDFIEMLRKQALRFKNTPCIGRTHGIHADITCFGLKWVLWHEEMMRNLARFKEAARNIEVGKLSGAVGNFANIPPFIQDYVCEKLGIQSANVSTQVIQRDRHAYAGRDRRFARADGLRGAQPPAHRGARGGGGVQQGTERFERHAPQTQPDQQREHHRLRPRDARLHGDLLRERGSVARA